MIRKAREADVPALVEQVRLNVDYHKQFSTYQEDFTEEEKNYFLRAFREDLNAPNSILLVAETDGTIDGFIQVIIKKKEAIVAQLYVQDFARKKGIASQLLKKVEELLKGKVTSFRVELIAENKAALNFYEKAGFMQDRIIMRKK